MGFLFLLLKMEIYRTLKGHLEKKPTTFTPEDESILVLSQFVNDIERAKQYY